MPRIARVVVPNVPHHITQRGVRSLPVFFNDGDRRAYLGYLHEEGVKHGVAFLGYCLMTNHVHLIAVPKRRDGLARVIGEAHRRYTRRVNFRRGGPCSLNMGDTNSLLVKPPSLVAGS